MKPWPPCASRAALLAALPLTLADPAGAAAPADSACESPRPRPVRVRFADVAGAEAIDALLSGPPSGGLQLRDAVSGALLWTAGPSAATVQRIAGMDAPFGDALTAIDMNGDGVHDRLYAADLAGRVWRLDLATGAQRDTWASGGVFADLAAVDGSRGFVAAPDVALIRPAGSAPWLSIALGTMSTSGAPASNRFYLLRDRDPLATGEERSAQALAPIREADLLPIESTSDAASASQDVASHPGFYVILGAGQVLAPSLTVNGVIVFTAAQSARSTVITCAPGNRATAPTVLDISSIDAIDGRTALDLNADGEVDARDRRMTLPNALPASAGIDIAPAGDGDPPGFRRCAVAELPITNCQVDTRVKRRWWRREDAD